MCGKIRCASWPASPRQVICSIREVMNIMRYTITLVPGETGNIGRLIPHRNVAGGRSESPPVLAIAPIG